MECPLTFLKTKGVELIEKPNMPTGVYIRTEEHKTNLSKSQKLVQNRPDVKEKQRLAHLGKTYSVEWRRSISRGLKGKSNFSGKYGANHPRWIEDRTLIKQYWTERNNPEYKQWRFAVWSRDSYTCKINNESCNGRIEAHHILGWKEYPELRYQINNGITLCHAHHPTKRAEEKRLEPIFKELISVS